MGISGRAISCNVGVIGACAVVGVVELHVHDGLGQVKIAIVVWFIKGAFLSEMCDHVCEFSNDAESFETARLIGSCVVEMEYATRRGLAQSILRHEACCGVGGNDGCMLLVQETAGCGCDALV